MRYIKTYRVFESSETIPSDVFNNTIKDMLSDISDSGLSFLLGFIRNSTTTRNTGVVDYAGTIDKSKDLFPGSDDCIIRIYGGKFKWIDIKDRIDQIISYVSNSVVSYRSIGNIKFTLDETNVRIDSYDDDVIIDEIDDDRKMDVFTIYFKPNYFLYGLKESKIFESREQEAESEFEKAYKNGSSSPNVDYLSKSWKTVSGKYHLYDNYYLYKDCIMSYSERESGDWYSSHLTRLEVNVADFRIKVMDRISSLETAFNKLSDVD